MKNKLTMLMILDGFGENANDKANAVKIANTPNIDKLMKTCPTTEVYTSGLNVGLPDGQMGNSEVGHTNIGAGRIIYQDLAKITKSIEDGDFFSKPEFVAAIENCKVEVNVVVKTHLEQLLEICTNYDTAQFTNTSVEALEHAKDTASAVIENKNATQDEVDEAYTLLISALQGLQVKVEVNKNALGTNLSMAQNILDNASDYKASTITGLDDLVKNARSIYKDVNATKKDVDDANAALRIALMKARKKPN